MHTALNELLLVVSETRAFGNGTKYRDRNVAVLERSQSKGPCSGNH